MNERAVRKSSLTDGIQCHRCGGNGVCPGCKGRGWVIPAEVDEPEQESESEGQPQDAFTVIATLVLLTAFWGLVTFFTASSLLFFLGALAWTSSGGVAGAWLFGQKGLHPAFGCLGGGLVGPVLVWLFFLIPSKKKHPRLWAVLNRVWLGVGIAGCVAAVVGLGFLLAGIPTKLEYDRQLREQEDRIKEAKAHEEERIRALQGLGNHQPLGKVPALPRSMTRDEFKRLVMGRSREGVIQAVGQPNSTSTLAGVETWLYTAVSRDPVTDRADLQAQVVFQGGGVVEVNFIGGQ